MAVKIILVDDDKLITESLKIILSQDENIEIIATGQNGKQAIMLCRENQVDVALLDVRMPELNGVEATKTITEETDTSVLILTTFDEDEFIKEGFKNGAKGYLLKNNPPDMIRSAIFAVAKGNTVVENQVISRMNISSSDKSKRLEGLTPREKDIVEKISEGLTNKEIAAELFLSEGTVKNNVTSILDKLDLKHRTQIAIYYLKD
jgi:DNA-binding NarL/FixJ family response regulator